MDKHLMPDPNHTRCTALIRAVEQLVSGTRIYGPPGHRQGRALRLLLNHLAAMPDAPAVVEVAGKHHDSHA